MAGYEWFDLACVLWVGLAVVFVLSGFLTGEWVAKGRELRTRLRKRGESRRRSRGRFPPGTRTHLP